MIRFIAVFCLSVIPLLAFSGTVQAQDCHALQYDGNSYTVCKIDTRAQHIDLFWRDRDGLPLGSFGRLQNHLRETGRSLSIAMNGGMYHRDLSPVGLFIKDGEQFQKASTRPGWGNFHLLPNGVFFMDEKGRPGVLETKAFLKSKIKPRLATQSGPMLVINGKLHPRFLEDSDSRKLRNGVGVKADGTTVIFAITENAVTFHEFGRLFRDHFKTPNALFLDGSVSSLHAKELNRSDRFRPMGPIIGVVEQAR